MKLALFIVAMLAAIIGACYLADNWPPTYAFLGNGLYVGFFVTAVVAWEIARHH